MTPIVSGEIAEDLAKYLADSEQTQCALGLGVSIDRTTSVASAGGFLLQVRPQGGTATCHVEARGLPEDRVAAPA